MEIKNVIIKKTNNKTFVVVGDTEKFGKNEILFEGISLVECYNYLEENGIKNFQYVVPKPRYKLFHKDGYCWQREYTLEKSIEECKKFNKEIGGNLIIYDTLKKKEIKYN